MAECSLCFIYAVAGSLFIIFYTLEELEAYGRKLRLMWHFRNDERELSYDPFKKKPKFDLKRKEAAIELYLNHLEEEISSLDYQVGYSNLTKGGKRCRLFVEKRQLCNYKRG